MNQPSDPGSVGPLFTTTPVFITPEILRLAKEIAGSAARVEFVQTLVEPYAEANECFAAVAEKTRRDGGSIQHGWTMWQLGDWMVEAEFHAVWRSPDGELVDISPKPDGESRIMFVVDPRLIYTGKPRENHRRALVKNMIVDDFIALARKQYQLRISPGWPMPAMASQEFKAIAWCSAICLNMMSAGQRGDDLCACRSGRRYKNCHSLIVKAISV